MPQFKIYSAEVRQFGEPAAIICAAFTNPGGYPRAESFVLLPDEKRSLRATQLSFSVKSFEGSPVDLNEEFMMMEALGQAKIDLGMHLHELQKAGVPFVSASPAIVETNFQALVAGHVHGVLPQLSAVHAKTELQELEDLLSWILKLPVLTKKPL